MPPTIIKSSKTYGFRRRGAGPKANVATEEFKVANGYVGPIPDWVKGTKLYVLATADGSITVVDTLQAPPTTTGVTVDSKAAAAASKKYQAALAKSMAQGAATAPETPADTPPADPPADPQE